MRGTNHFCLLKDQAQCFAKRSLNKFFHMDFFLETFKLLSLILAYLDTVPEIFYSAVYVLQMPTLFKKSLHPIMLVF